MLMSSLLCSADGRQSTAEVERYEGHSRGVNRGGAGRDTIERQDYRGYTQGDRRCRSINPSFVFRGGHFVMDK